MARSLLVAPAAEGVGLARTCLGLLRALDRRGIKVAFVKPVAQPRPDGGPDRSAAGDRGHAAASPGAADHRGAGTAAGRGLTGCRAGEDRRRLGADLLPCRES